MGAVVGAVWDQQQPPPGPYFGHKKVHNRRAQKVAGEVSGIHMPISQSRGRCTKKRATGPISGIYATL